MLPTAPVSGRCHDVAVWAGSELVTWGGTEACGGFGRRLADGAVYAPPPAR